MITHKGNIVSHQCHGLGTPDLNRVIVRCYLHVERIICDHIEPTPHLKCNARHKWSTHTHMPWIYHSALTNTDGKRTCTYQVRISLSFTEFIYFWLAS